LNPSLQLGRLRHNPYTIPAILDVKARTVRQPAISFLVGINIRRRILSVVCGRRELRHGLGLPFRIKHRLPPPHGALRSLADPKILL
jgi:hypothetical protein